MDHNIFYLIIQEENTTLAWVKSSRDKVQAHMDGKGKREEQVSGGQLKYTFNLFAC